MLDYKRNQIEEAIAEILEPKSQGPTEELRTRVKRLLDVDRALGRNPRSSDPERAHYAFYSDDKPGRGVEIRFSAYEAFALLIGLRLMALGWPQGFSVRILRRVREDLEKHHARILKQDPTKLFDQAAIMRDAKAGDIAYDNTDPVLLVVASTAGKGQNGEKSDFQCAVRRGSLEAMKWVWGIGQNLPYMMYEIVGTAHVLANKLVNTEPRPRGRGA